MPPRSANNAKFSSFAVRVEIVVGLEQRINKQGYCAASSYDHGERLTSTTTAGDPSPEEIRSSKIIKVGLRLFSTQRIFAFTKNL